MKRPLFEIIVSAVTLIAIFVALLQLPFGIDAYDDRITPVMFFSMGLLALASGLIIRHQFLKSSKQPNKDAFYKGFFTWALPAAVYVLLLPWVIAGVFNADDMNTFGVLGMFILLIVIATLGGIVAITIFWVPIEIAARGLWRVIVTRGKEGQGQLAIGLYFMICEAAIIVGYFSATTERVGQYGQAQLVQALLGLPGDYTIKDPALLWVTRGLLALMIGLPLLFGTLKKKHPDSSLVNKIDSSIP